MKNETMVGGGVNEEGRPQAAAKAPRPLKAITTIWCGGLIACATGVMPALFDRGHRVDDVLHGAVVPVALGCCCFLTILILGIVAMRRRVDRDRSPWLACGSTLGVLLAAGMAIVLVPAMRDHRLAADLVARGVRTPARVVHRFTEGCGKTGCRTGIEYSFVVQGRATSVRGVTDEGETSRHASGEYLHAMATGTLPIRYDPVDPDRSMVDWNDSVRRRAAEGVFGTGSWVWFVLLALGLAFAAAVLISSANALSDRKRIEEGGPL